MFGERFLLRLDAENVSRTVDTKASGTGWYVVPFLGLVLFLCYASVVFTPYGFTDDYSLLVDSMRGEWAAWTQVIAAGRPTYAVLLGVFFPLLQDIDDLRYLRLMGVAGIVLLAWVVYRVLVQVGWTRHHSVLLSVIVCTLPSFQVYAAWATTSFYVLATLAAGGAFHLAVRACNEQRPLSTGSQTVGAVLLMGLALTIHQAAAMFFWVFAVIDVFKPGATLPDVRRCFLWYSAVTCAGLIVGFGVYQYGLAMYGYSLPSTRSNLTQNVLEKAWWFCRQPLKDALNVLNLFPRRWLAWSSAVVITGGLLLYVRGGIKERLWQLLIALSILPLSYLPNLLVAENWSSYRTQSALTSVVTVYAFLALWGYGRILRRRAAPVLTVVLGCSALTSSLLAAQNVRTYFALPQARELRLLRDQLAQEDLAHRQGIYIIGARWQDSLAPGVRYDEFGLPSSAAGWAPGPMTYLLLREIHPQRADLPIEAVPADGLINPPPDMLVVDMRKLLQAPAVSEDDGIKPPQPGQGSTRHPLPPSPGPLGPPSPDQERDREPAPDSIRG